MFNIQKPWTNLKATSYPQVLNLNVEHLKCCCVALPTGKNVVNKVE